MVFVCVANRQQFAREVMLRYPSEESGASTMPAVLLSAPSSTLAGTRRRAANVEVPS
jgi:hypothetical protein